MATCNAKSGPEVRREVDHGLWITYSEYTQATPTLRPLYSIATGCVDGITSVLHELYVQQTFSTSSYMYLHVYWTLA